MELIDGGNAIAAQAYEKIYNALTQINWLAIKLYSSHFIYFYCLLEWSYILDSQWVRSSRATFP